MAHYINMTPQPCRSCGVPLLIRHGRYWPHKVSPVEATPTADGYLALEGDEWRVTAQGERPLLANMNSLYRFHSREDCADRCKAKEVA